MAGQNIQQIARDEVRKHAAEPNAHGVAGTIMGENHAHTGGADGKQLIHANLLARDADDHDQYAKTISGDRLTTEISNPRDRDHLEYDDATGTWKSANGVIRATGIPSDEAGLYMTTLSYNMTTRTVTIAPKAPATTFDVFIQGYRYTFTGAQSLTHPATTGGYFFYFEIDGTFTYGTSPWSIIHDAPVFYVYYDATTGRALPFEERHHAGRDVWWHQNQHRLEGTKAGTGFAMTGYTLSDGSSDAAVAWALATGRLSDEDIDVDTATVAAGGPYTLLRRDTGGEWIISTGNTLPFFYTTAAIQYNQFTGSAWQLTAVPEDNFVNYWVFGLTCLPESDITGWPGGPTQIVVIPGQAVYSTEALAHAESVSNLSWGTLPFQEIAPLYQITLRKNATAPLPFTNTARCAITRVVRVVGSASIITQSAQIDHGSQAGLADDDHLGYARTLGSMRVDFFADPESLTPDAPGEGETGTDFLFFYNPANDRFEARGYFNCADFAVQVSAPAYKAGRVWYDDAKKALSYYPDEFSSSSMQIGKETWLRVRNTSGGTIAEGEVVKIVGATGQTPTISKAIATTDSSADVIGVATTTINNNAFGLVTVFGEVHDLNTNAWAEGTILYLSALTAGLLTSTMPTAPNHSVSVATVLYQHASNGKILVHPSEAVINDDHITVDASGYDAFLDGIDPTLHAALERIDDKTVEWSGNTRVIVDSTTPQNLQPLLWDSATGKYKNTTVVLDTISDVNAPSPNDGDMLTWDNGTSRWVAAAPTSATPNFVFDNAGALVVSNAGEAVTV